MNQYLVSRPNLIKNKIIIVDGLIGGGKGLISQIISAIPNVEMWIHKPEVEQICGLYHMRHLSLNGALVLLKTWFDEETYNQSILRNSNFRMKDMSSVLKYPRKLKYFIRYLKSKESGAYDKFIRNKCVLNFMTHVNTAYSLPIFMSLRERLIYIRLVRSPMTEYMLNHLAQWSKRWGNESRNGLLLYKNNDLNKTNHVPYFISPSNKKYHLASPLEKAVCMLETWQKEGDIQIDSIKMNNFGSKIFEIPFEKFVFDPDKYIQEIAETLGTEIDNVTKKEMIKQRVPRKSLHDAPKNKIYESLGWKKPNYHKSIEEEFKQVREFMKKNITIYYQKILDEIHCSYLERYKI